MNIEAIALFSDEEKDILQEVMNIAFGNATADLAEMIDIFVVLNVPEIQAMKVNDLSVYFKKNIHDFDKIWALDQKFWGDFSGSGFLIFPARSGKTLIDLFDTGDTEEVESKQIESLEKEVLLEIGNILVGACVGKIAGLLNTNVTYSPPVASQSESKDFSTLVEPFNFNQTAIIMKTVFEFENQHINGLLFLITNQDSIEWLKKALYDYLESFDE
ncbi:MAG: chemotaxis protein CheC [Desulfobacterales bacterium]|nr:chemotaxis protein CheC [Desulfobacterales bacterium]